MLTYLLAIVVALGSFAFYMTAFFFPELHRKYDLIWSGVGMFYALVLWVCAGRITGGVLLGQIASASLIGWFLWQTLELRWEQTPIGQRTPVSHATGSFGQVVQGESTRLWDYLQTEEFRSRLPRNVEQLLQQANRLFLTTKEWAIALVSTTFKTPPPDPVDPLNPLDPQIPEEEKNPNSSLR